MKETPLSICEREFILKAISEKKRLDGRETYDYRRTKITFGIDRGCCEVILGNTRVLAQASCEVTAPKQGRPSEGILHVNVELSPMASPQFEAGRQSEEAVELNRLLERCLKESRCVDTESLCIMAGIKVWQVRCDIQVLNHDGNMLDCASLAAISSLAHFRRPDVTVSGEEVTIHSLEDRDPIPLSVHHMPICVTFAFYHQGKFLLVDPQECEEKVMEGKVVIGMNKHREVCTLQMTGSMLLLKDQVLRCSNVAVVKVTEMTQLIQTALQNDAKARAAGERFGFASSLETKKVTANQQDATDVAMDTVEATASDVLQAVSSEDGYSEGDEAVDTKVHILGKGTGTIGEGGASTWDVDEEGEEEMMDELIHKQVEKKPVINQGVIHVTGELSGDSEEEETVVLATEDLAIKSQKKKQTIDLSKALKTTTKKKKKTKPKS